MIVYCEVKVVSDERARLKIYPDDNYLYEIGEELFGTKDLTQEQLYQAAQTFVMDFIDDGLTEPLYNLIRHGEIEYAESSEWNAGVDDVVILSVERES